MSFLRQILLAGLCLFAFAVSAQNNLKSPDEFLPHRLGEQFTPHHLLTSYFEYLAANAPRTMRLEQYGRTNEARPLQVAIFASPENLQRLEQIRQNNLRIAGMLDGQPNLNNPVAIVWISMSVHGNEPSGSECSMILAHKLAGQTESEVREWLKNTVVIIDPSVNPDGYDRYTHWNRMAGNLLKTVHPDSREHREPWPGGRVNHYYFDLNRDWAWATQAETRQRLAIFHRWLPHVHPDIHEQGINEPYYFAPAAEPMHDYITPWQREFQTQIGKNNAQRFDAQGWLYFTKEVFDLFYPSYGDTYPMFNGSIGMTYEQAGNSSAGRAILTDTDDTLTLHDRIAHHLTTILATIEISSKNAPRLVENFRHYYTQNTQPRGPYKAYVIRSTNSPNRINDLCQLLDRHQIKYGLAGAAGNGLKGFDYIEGKEKTVSIQENDLVISAYQQKSVLLQVLFDPESRLSDSLTYDITAWALPFAHGLDAVALKDRLEPKKPYSSYKAPEPAVSNTPYAWCVRRTGLADAVFLSAVLQQGVKVRYSTRAFESGLQQFAAGTIIINRADNRSLSGDVDNLVKEAARQANIALTPVFTGFMEKGNDLGSETFAIARPAEVAIVYGDDVDENSFGQIWYCFERELNYPIAAVPADKLNRIRLSDFSTLILPNGYYNFNDGQFKLIQEWVRQGGRLIAVEGGARAFTDRDGFAIKKKEDPKKEADNSPKVYQNRERDRISDQLPGAIVKAKSDATHPLAFGLGDQYFSLKTSPDAVELNDNGTPVIYLEENFQRYGFIGSRVKKRLEKTPIAATQKMGNGEVVYFMDNPLFRAFWQQGKVLFSNAIFF